ncbi:hypothetical protein ABZW47_11940 [Streptomyces sp. NPDC004549]|uniref:hypothetical protein n=1 Tax=Streptomyces sp. NPDC004549 TaxID=3154283 RepID=UPI0033B66856
MQSTTVRRTALAAAVAAALSGIAACGAQDDGKGGKASHDVVPVSPIAALRAADKSTDRAESAKVRSTMSLGKLMDTSADGVLAWGDGMRGEMTITYTGGDMAELMRKAGSASSEARYLPDAFYSRMSDAFARQNSGKHWVRYGYADLAKLGGRGSTAYLQDQVRHSSPNQSVKLLLASGDVKKVGEEKVDGTATTHYAGTVDIAALARKNSGLTASQLSELKSELTQAGVTTETIDVWLDGKNLLVKKVERAKTANGTMVSTAHYSDYGVKVTAEAPAAGDTKDFKDLMKATTAGSGVTS